MTASASSGRVLVAGTPRRATAVGEPSGRTRAIVGGAVGTGAIVAAWALLARRQPELILPSPVQTWSAMRGLFADGAVVGELATTLGRAVVGVGIALAVGVVWGTVSARSAWVAAIGRPALSTLMAMPPVILVALGMVWFGPGDAVARLVIAVVALPLIVVAVAEAIENLDRDLLEVAAVFRLPRTTVWRHVIVPGVASPVVAALSVTFGQALRVTVMAELLATANGVGAAVARSRANLATADLFAWAVLLVAVVLLFELALLRPLTSRLLRWRDAAGTPPVPTIVTTRRSS